MIELIEKIKSAIKELEKEHGHLLICALFLRVDPLERWDVLVSASWLDPREMKSYTLVTSPIKHILSDSEFIQISRVVILDQTDPVVSFLLDLETLKNGKYKELSTDILSEKFKFTIKKAYLLRSQKTP